MSTDPQIIVFLAICCLCALFIYVAGKKDKPPAPRARRASHDPFEGLEEAVKKYHEEERAKKRIADIKEIYTGLRILSPHLSHEDAAARAVEIYEQSKQIS